MSDLDLDEIYTFTIKLARDVSHKVPHFTPRSTLLVLDSAYRRLDASLWHLSSGNDGGGMYANDTGGRYDQSGTAETVRDGIDTRGEVEFC